MYSLTLLTSAFLLFLIQPMVAKRILPFLGGTPAVWNTCMVFYQATLLAGYLYAHATSWLSVRRQTILHAMLLLLPLLVLKLPIEVDVSRLESSIDAPIISLLTVLILSVGLPFFVVSTTGPLLQKWFATTESPGAKDPYFLFGASNLGSMLALLGYPMFIERYLPLQSQSSLWAAGYIVFMVLTIGCAAWVWRTKPATSEPSANPTSVGRPHVSTFEGSDALTLIQRLKWLALATVPSSLMLGATTHVTTDLAAIPLLWVIPLALYLLSFIVVFARFSLRLHKFMIVITPVLILVVLFLMIIKLAPMFFPQWGVIPLHFLVLFFVAMVCHGELARTRPPVEKLTEFYLWIAVGGVLGGLFNAIIAPQIFDRVVEYPLAMVIACLLLPRFPTQPDKKCSRWLDGAVPIALAIFTIVLTSEFLTLHLRPDRLSKLLNFEPGDLNLMAKRLFRFDLDQLNTFLRYGLPFVLCYLFVSRPVRFGLSLGAILLANALAMHVDKNVLHESRNFFGVVRVDEDGEFRRFIHGTTIHGVQSLDPARREEPLMYFHRDGPLGDIFAVSAGQAPPHVAVIGLGTGTIACYGRPNQKMTYYEIDPAVKDVAEDSRYFTFLQDSRDRGVELQVILGDARINIADAPDRTFGLIIMDAFSSDAVPVHLITREAMQLYLTKLAEGGLLVTQISNRYLDLAPVLGSYAASAGLVAFVGNDPIDGPDRSASAWVVIAHQKEDVGKLADNSERWERLSDDQDVKVWTDDFSNLLSALQWQKQ